mgnify:CR=1 FL=1
MYGRHKNEIFSCFFEFERKIDDLLLIKIFILLSKYYPEYKIKYSDFYKTDGEVSWEDAILKSEMFYDESREDTIIVHLSVPIYVSDDNIQLKSILIEEGIGIFYGVEETTGKNSMGIDFYANLYTDQRVDQKGGKAVIIDQSVAAQKNRQIMKFILEEMESILEADITEFLSPFYLDDKYIYKYGIREDAVLTSLTS